MLALSAHIMMFSYFGFPTLLHVTSQLAGPLQLPVSGKVAESGASSPCSSRVLTNGELLLILLLLPASPYSSPEMAIFQLSFTSGVLKLG